MGFRRFLTQIDVFTLAQIQETMSFPTTLSDPYSTESAAIFPLQHFWFQVATTSTRGIIDSSIDPRARSVGI